METATARAALEAGADILNDVWAGLYDGQMLALAAERMCRLFSCIIKKKKYTMMSQKMSVHSSFSQRAQAALEAGVAKDNIWIDPGFGGYCRKCPTQY